MAFGLRKCTPGSPRRSCDDAGRHYAPPRVPVKDASIRRELVELFLGHRYALEAERYILSRLHTPVRGAGNC